MPPCGALVPPVLVMPIGPLHSPQRTSPDNNQGGRRAAASRPSMLLVFALVTALVARGDSTVPLLITTCARPAARRACAASQVMGSIIRNAGTALTIHASRGFGRATRLPVAGSVTGRTSS